MRTLSVARIEDDGNVTWLPLVFGEGSLAAINGFHSQADVVIDVRQLLESQRSRRGFIQRAPAPCLSPSSSSSTPWRTSARSIRSQSSRTTWPWHFRAATCTGPLISSRLNVVVDVSASAASSETSSRRQ